MTDSLDRRAELLLVFVMTIWAVNAPLAKAGLGLLDPFVFNSIRYVVACVVLLVVVRSRTKWITVEQADRGRFLRLGILASIVYQVGYIVGLNYTTAGNSAVLLSTSPLWTAAISARLNNERIPLRTFASMGISFIGIVLIIAGSGSKLEFGSKAIVGDLLSLGCAVLWAMNTTMQKPLLTRYPALQLTIVSTGIGAVGLTLLAIPSGSALSWSTVPPVAFGIAVLSGTASIAVANVLWSHGVKQLGPHRTAAFNNLVPVIAFIISYFAFDEPVLFVQIVGAALTVSGVWWARR